MPRLVTVLMVVSTALAGTIYAELTSSVAGGDGSLVAAPRSQPVQSAKTEPAITQPAGAALADTILARPLFAPDRRPAGKAKLAAAPQTVAIPRLSGIIMSDNQGSAIFAAGDGQRPVVAELGGHVGEYVVHAIEHEKITLVGPGGTRILQPSFDPNPRRTEPPASAVVAQAPFAAASAVMPSLRNLAGFGGPPVSR